MKRILSLLLAVLIMVSVLPGDARAVGSSSSPTITVESTKAAPGSTVSVDVTIQNNPGILGATLKFTFDEALTLVEATAGEAFSYLTMTKPGKFTSPCQFVWDGLECSEDDIQDGVILTLTFEVADTAVNGDTLSIAVASPDNDIYDNDLNVVTVSTVNGGVTVVDYTPGDVNGDEKVNTADVILLRRYVVGGYDVSINPQAANVSGDDKVNSVDIILLRRYIVGGYDVDLLPDTATCDHTLEAVPYVAPTCTEDGNIAYWYCSSCGKYFSDENGTNTITLDSTVLPATGHTPVTDPAVPATANSTGLTEGSHCSVCGEVLVAQEVIPVITENVRTITYHVANGDSYISTLAVENDNYTVLAYTESYTLKSVSVPGYRFLGWYDLPSGTNAEVVKKIEPGTEDIELYAHWEAIEYTVQFESSLERAEFPTSRTYTVNTGTTLPTLSLSNYVFAGWSDTEGNLYKRIPVGTTGDITLIANWTSERNKTWTKSKLDDPVIVESEEDGVIMFAYEIGTIENIPLYTVHDFGYISEDGISRTHEETYSVQTSETMMETYAQTVANATTNSSSWTLSSDWNETTSVNESWRTEKGYTEEQIDEIAKTDSTNWNISSGTSGSASTSATSSNSNSESNEVKIATSDESSVKTHVAAGLDTSTTVSSEASVTASAKAKYPGAEAGVEATAKTGVTSTVSTSLSSAQDTDDTHTQSLDIGSNNSTVTMDSSSTSSTSGWSQSSSYGGSSAVTSSSTTSKALSEAIAEEKGYGKSYQTSSGTVSYDGTSQTVNNEDQYSSAVTYDTTVQASVTESWTTQNTKSGYHRWIKVGTAHVFGVVSYDIASQSYFVFTYSVMDDEIKDFEDYSLTTSSFNDNENGVITFEIPAEVTNYVADRVAYSQGLKVQESTGIIQRYEGTDDFVVIPEYITPENGTNVVKVTGISETAFQGNTNIKAVVLSDFITEIPDSAFAGCTSLYAVGAKSVTSIGASAFAGCTNYVEADISSQVTYLGENAFDGTENLYVFAGNASVAKNALTCDADTVALYLSYLNNEDGSNALSGEELVAPNAQQFAINGSGGIFTDTTLISAAPETYLYSCSFVSNSKIPFQITSDYLVLDKCTVSARGIGLVLDTAKTELALQGDVTIESSTGNALLCRNLKLYEFDSVATGMLTVNGAMVVCGTIEGQEFLNCEDIQYVDEETFQKYLHSYTLSFDANGGTCSTTSIEVPNGSAIGTLPIADRENFNFVGWYTEPEGGTLVTENTVFSGGNDVTVYAHWSANAYTVSWSTGKGYTITVDRTESPYAGAATGTISSGDTVYYGDVLSVAYAAATGYQLGSCGKTAITVTGNVTSSDIYASAAALTYTVSWNTGTGYTITVNRTESPYAGAATGALSNGATVYYGDVLSVTYAAATGYTLSSSGAAAVTVTGNVTSSTIYASATANLYTYNVVYKSSNGTALGTTSVTYAYGTTNTIYAPAKSGYTTPASQSVTWDSTSAKTITFTYGIASVTNGQSVTSGTWWTYNSGSRITYSATAEYQNRTSTSVQVRIKWKNTIVANYYYGYAQYFSATIGGVSTGNVTIASSSTWSSSSTSARSVTVYSGWVTVPVSATQTTVSISGKWWDTNYSGTYSKTMTIPAY